MMLVRHPFQKLCCVRPAQGDQNILVAASGPYICCFDVFQGVLLSRWPRNDEDEDSADDSDLNGIPNSNEDNPRPMKRQKVSDSRRSSADSVEIVAEHVKGQRRKPKVISLKTPSVSHIQATREGGYVVAITTDDKCIRVLRCGKRGRLQLLSERCMPKRLCAIALTPDQKTIIAGDKFGDVYSLPLHPAQHSGVTPDNARMPDVPGYKPSASELTVHTKGNLEALRQQQQQKAFKPKKEGPTFEHKLLLGHVSLLTDVVVAELKMGGHLRQHVLTSDRDEHIRVSRGIPQTHIIESYCSGHKEFVSKLCVLPWEPSILVVGSGESSIKVYDWTKGQLLRDIPYGGLIRTEIEGLPNSPPLVRKFDKLTVSGIWPFESAISMLDVDNEGCTGFLIISLEGLPLLLSYLVTHEGTISHHQTLHLEGNALDVTFLGSKTALLVSVDTIHTPGSTSVPRSDGSLIPSPLQSFSLSQRDTETVPKWHPSAVSDKLNETIRHTPSAAADYQEPGTPKPNVKHNILYSPLGEFLYGLENLRKKGGHEIADAEHEDDLNDALEAGEEVA